MTDPIGTVPPPDDPSSSMTSLNIDVEADHLDIDIDIEDETLGDAEDVSNLMRRAAVNAVAAGLDVAVPPSEIYVRIVGVTDSQQLNHEYRGKNKPTNVLSFPALEPARIKDACQQAVAGGPPLLLGDIIIAGPVIVEEAEAQNKNVNDHLIHMVVHGVLHLLGYDHIDDQGAHIMEDLERIILSGFGIADPYQEELRNDG